MSKTKNIGHYEVGGFIVDFYSNDKKATENKVCISTVSKNMSVELTGYTFLYLLASVKDGDITEIHSFCVMLYGIVAGVYQDKEFAADIIKSVSGYLGRLEEKAEEQAANVSETDEQTAQAFMESVTEYIETDKKQRKKIQKENKLLIKEVLEEQRLKNGEESKDE